LDVLSQFIEYVGNLGTVLLLMSGDFGVEFGVFTFFLTVGIRFHIFAASGSRLNVIITCGALQYNAM
jgi:hypothetical protein